MSQSYQSTYFFYTKATLFLPQNRWSSELGLPWSAVGYETQQFDFESELIVYRVVKIGILLSRKAQCNKGTELE